MKTVMVQKIDLKNFIFAVIIVSIMYIASMGKENRKEKMYGVPTPVASPVVSSQ